MSCTPRDSSTYLPKPPLERKKKKGRLVLWHSTIMPASSIRLANLQHLYHLLSPPVLSKDASSPLIGNPLALQNNILDTMSCVSNSFAFKAA